MIFPHTIELLPASTVTSSMGATSFTYPTTGTSYRAYVQSGSSNMAEINFTEGNRELWRAYIEPAATLNTPDRFRYNGDTFEIFSISPEPTPRGLHHTKVMAYKVSQL